MVNPVSFGQRFSGTQTFVIPEGKISTLPAAHILQLTLGAELLGKFTSPSNGLRPRAVDMTDGRLEVKIPTQGQVHVSAANNEFDPFIAKYMQDTYQATAI